MQIGLPELLIVLFVVFMVFGPKRFLKVGKELGSTVREIGKSVGMTSSEEDKPKEAADAKTEKPSTKEKAIDKK